MLKISNLESFNCWSVPYLWLKACYSINLSENQIWVLISTEAYHTKRKVPLKIALGYAIAQNVVKKLNPSLLKYQKWKSPLKIKSQNQKLTKIKVENPESPISKSLNLERRLCLALAGLSLQKIKIALVGSGRRSEDFRGPTNLRSYI